MAQELESAAYLMGDGSTQTRTPRQGTERDVEPQVVLMHSLVFDCLRVMDV